MGAFQNCFGPSTYADPGDVRLGVDRGDGVNGTLALPVVGDVRLGTAFGAAGAEFTGTLIVGFLAPEPGDNEYLNAMNAGHFENELVFGESWIFESREFPAIYIDTLTTTERAAMGGRFRDATVQIGVRESIFIESGIDKGGIIFCRDEKLRVMDFGSDGDGSKTLICGPSGIEIPRRQT